MKQRIEQCPAVLHRFIFIHLLPAYERTCMKNRIWKSRFFYMLVQNSDLLRNVIRLLMKNQSNVIIRSMRIIFSEVA